MTLKRALEYRAAGGVVLDDAGRVLMIERWVTRNGAPAHEIRLPKGHVEPGETDDQAALRETCEESGYCGLLIIADLGEEITEFDYPPEDARVRRTEHYFLMRLTDPVRGEPHFDSPDAEEARYLPRWAANLDEAQALLTYSSEREFVLRAATWLQVEG
jgi:8-oxo-dGTP pyrophosphatase MutT (NUDIX family)